MRNIFLSLIVTLIAIAAMSCQPQNTHHFNDIATATADAQQNNRRLLLDFHANWCETCLHLQEKLNDPEIQKLLSKYNIVTIDGTKPSEHVDQLMQRYNVETFPALILFDIQSDKSQREISRIEDDISINELKSILSQ